MDIQDLKIMEILDKDSRTPYDEIGKIIGLTGNAVRSRVMNMLNSGVIEKFTFKLRPELFGVRSYYAQFSLEKNQLDLAEKVDKLIGKDIRISEIISSLDGIIILKIDLDKDEDVKLLINDLNSKLGNVDYLEIVRPRNPNEEIIELNNSLLRVVYHLTQDVRMSVSELAKKCNMTSKSVRFYLENIYRHRIGRFSIDYQPYKISNRIFVYFFISKQDLDYIHFASLFEQLKREFKTLLFKDYLVVEPPGVFYSLTTESLAEIDAIERRIIDFLNTNYTLRKMFPSKTIFRPNLIDQKVKERIEKLETIYSDDE